jgi:hypothetical protein
VRHGGSATSKPRSSPDIGPAPFLRDLEASRAGRSLKAVGAKWPVSASELPKDAPSSRRHGRSILCERAGRPAGNHPW